MYYYGAYLESTGVVKNDLDFVKMTLLYFEATLNELRLRCGALKYTEPFTAQSYKLEGTEFTIRGFEFERGVKVESVTFNRVEPDVIVGNRDAKFKSHRVIQRILTIDFLTGKNPFNELGGLSMRRLGYGPPGTGKSLQIASNATEFDKGCERLGYEFLFHPFPDTPVSEFQGKSAQKIVEWFQPMTEKPRKIIYAPIDDAENALEERTRQGVSEGVRGVIGVFLRYTEGAYAPNYGNSLIDIFTNIPDQVDKAVLSRVMDRFLIAGAETKEDMMDQEKKWYAKYETMAPGFVNMKDPKGYEWYGTQKMLQNLGEVYKNLTEPSNETLRDIVAKVRAGHDITEQEFFGILFNSVKQTYPNFTSRDLRNIDENISSRIMDFDLEEDWFEHPDKFFRKDYDTKKAMIIEMMKSNMRGLSFAEIRLQESIVYLDNMVRMASQEEEREIERRVKEYLIQEKVAKRLAALKNG